MYKQDCRHFKGDMPCTFHKDRGWKCEGCSAYDPIDERILIIKHGRMGDVLRTTPLLRKLKKKYPRAEIWWITKYPELLPKIVDVPLVFDSAGILQVQATEFDIAYNLDKYALSCSLMNQVRSKVKKGFYLSGSKTVPFCGAEYKFNMGIDDKLSKANKKSYQEEMFEICGFQFTGEEYVMDRRGKAFQKTPINNSEKIVGLNTGCGPDWRSRLWKIENWITLAKLLREKSLIPLLLGGCQEHEVNKEIVKESGALYFGHFPFYDFVELVDKCGVVVTVVTLAMHVAVGLKKKIIILNSVFNKNEHDPYGRSRIIEPKLPCKCYYKAKCENPDYHCTDSIKPEKVLREVLNAIKK